jgi:S1-C subfamily serine protease
VDETNDPVLSLFISLRLWGAPMKRQIAVLVVVLSVLTGKARAAEADKPTLSVARITTTIQEGQRWGRAVQRALFGVCSYEPINLSWGVGAGRLNVRAFEQPTRAELKKEGFPIAGDPSDPFAEKDGGDLTLGGTITSISSDFCFSYQAGRPEDIDHVSGSTTIEIDWQLYSNIERRVVAKVHETGAYTTKAEVRGGLQAIMLQALNDSVRKLTASAEFKEAARQRTGALPSTSPSSPKSALVLTGAKSAKPIKIPEAVGAVVLVLSGGGHGSGFLVSSDGYLMTAEHVVGADKYVKVRWSDGLEGVGEVIRTDKRRDVALIKTDPRGRQPLALRRTAPQPGDTVFAIGAPLDVNNQSTVTRGVASANRILDGFSFIQSDVTISPGNSGGPLLDEKGEVLGICDLSYRPAGADVPTGINYFIPIDDALRFLSAEPQ